MNTTSKDYQPGMAQPRIRRIQFLCLSAALLILLAFFLLEDRASGVAYLLVERYLSLPAMAFLGASLCRELPRENRRALYAGLAMVALFFVNQVLHQVLEAESKHVGTFVCAYALCLPFAAATEDGRRQRGLKWMAALFLGVSVLLLVYTALLFCGAVPGYLQNYVYWDGSRLFALGHPNICATLLMIGMALAAGFALSCGRVWVKAALLVLMLLQFIALSLTNGRTTIILTCLLLGGIVFCAVRGQGWKRALPALLAAVIVMAASFGASRAVYGWNQNRLLALLNAPASTVTTEPTATTEAEQETRSSASAVPDAPEKTSPKASQPLVSEQYQGTLANDLKTLNGRTVIWKTVRYGLRDNPRLNLMGTEYVEMILSRYSPAPIFHTHNSWLEALYRMGIPGLAAALVITVMAVWSTVVILWRNTDLWKSCIALMTLCLMGCAMLEPYLFVVDVSYFYLDFLFLMCLGYLCLWRGEKAA